MTSKMSIEGLLPKLRELPDEDINIADKYI